MFASQEGHVEVVDKLLQHGATVDLQEEVHTLYVWYAMQANTCAKLNLRTVRCARSAIQQIAFRFIHVASMIFKIA